MIKKNIQSMLSGVNRILIGGTLICLLSACSEVDMDDGDVINTIPLPLPGDSTLDLFCLDVGVGNERCILDDPANPFAKVGFDDEVKFELYSTSPSPKASFYLWATAQARSPRGENQYYTGLALHEMFTDGGAVDLVIKEQVIKAYHALLDNHFNEVTFVGPFIDGTGNEVYFPISVRELVLDNIILPIPTDAPNDICGQSSSGAHPDGLATLFIDNLEMLSRLGEWGYTLDLDSCVITRNF